MQTANQQLRDSLRVMNNNLIAFIRASEEMRDMQSRSLDLQEQMWEKVRDSTKAIHFLERGRDTTHGLLHDHRRHVAQQKIEIANHTNSETLSQSEKMTAICEAKQHHNMYRKNRIIALLRGSCWSPLLFLLR